MATLKRVGTQQESLKKAVAEAMSSAKEKGESFTIAPTKSSLVQQTPQEKAASQTESEAPGIAARWTEGSMTDEEASAASTLKAKHAAVQQVENSETDARADSLPEQVSLEQVNPVQPIPQAQPVMQDVVQQEKAPKLPKQSAATPELVDNSDVQSRRLDLSKMQVALGHEDTSGATAAAFNPVAVYLGVPAQPRR